MIKQVNTTLTLSDGKKVNCALNMASLFKLEQARPEVYEQTSQGMNGATKDKTHAAVDVLYGAYKIERVWAARSINSNSQKRGKLTEILVHNYLSTKANAYANNFMLEPEYVAEIDATNNL